ncbi:MAG: cyclopropane-fatty-acyl-phospholipid synthase family protein [Salinibacter sp.]|uniref:SAM-dependent methyltransferase n=1 Tax=Salinibacter sp. TaxID=2065818 RepID=UPI0035D4C041
MATSSTSPTDVLRRYYERNTQLFLALSGGRSTRSLHRPVWGEGVETREEAFAYPYQLVLRAAHRVGPAETHPAPGDSPRRSFHVLDLGCGVGGAVEYLLNRFEGPMRATGVTLSGTQVRLARQSLRQAGVPSCRYTFREADFHDLPNLGPVDLAFGIESFVLARQTQAVFEETARVLRPGARLVLIDDFLVPPAQRPDRAPPVQSWIDTFQNGWHARGLCSVREARAEAKACGFRLTKQVDLTSALALRRPRDQLIEWLVVPLRPLLWKWDYFRGLIGGHALQQCLAAGAITYRLLVFEWDPGSEA